MNKKTTINELDIEELAACICKEKQDGDIEFEEIEQRLFDKYEISYDNYSKIVRELFEKLHLGVSPLTNTPMIGFSEGNTWLLAKGITNEFINSVIHWMTEGEDVGKGWEREITEKGEPKFKITITSVGNLIDATNNVIK